MRCNYCGTELDDGTVFCTGCGNRVRQDGTAPIQQQIKKSEPAGRNGNPWIAVIIGAIGVVIGWFLSGLLGMLLGVIGMVMGIKSEDSAVKVTAIILGVISIVFCIIAMFA